MEDFSGIQTVSYRCVSESPELFEAYTLDEPKSPHRMTREELIGRVRQLEAQVEKHEVLAGIGRV